MSKTPSAMIVTNHFPPVAAAGTHRVVGLCRYLAERGWHVTVITAAPSKESSLDEELLDSIPEAVRVVRTAAPDLPLIMAKIFKRRKARSRTDKQTGSTTVQGTPPAGPSRIKRTVKRLVDWLSWWLHVPDGRTGWFIPAFWGGLREGMRRRPDVIFSSAPVWTGHIVATTLSHVLRVPSVADFRDPWCGSAFRNIPYRWHQYANRVLEKSVVGRARKITCAWNGIRRHLVESYPNRAADITTILNGFDPEFIDQVSPASLDATARVFLHTGSFYGPRSPVPLLEAVKLLRVNGRQSCQNAKFAFVGLPTYNGRPLADIASEYGVDTDVHVLPRVPHREAIGLLKGANVALLFGQSGKESLASIPAKAYDYIGVGIPVLAIGAGEEVCNVMREGGCQVWKVPADDTAQIASTIREIVDTLDRGQFDQAESRKARGKFSRREMASRIESVLLETLVQRERNSRDGRDRGWA